MTAFLDLLLSRPPLRKKFVKAATDLFCALCDGQRDWLGVDALLSRLNRGTRAVWEIFHSRASPKRAGPRPVQQMLYANLLRSSPAVRKSPLARIVEAGNRVFEAPICQRGMPVLACLSNGSAQRPVLRATDFGCQPIDRFWPHKPQSLNGLHHEWPKVQRHTVLGHSRHLVAPPRAQSIPPVRTRNAARPFQ